MKEIPMRRRLTTCFASVALFVAAGWASASAYAQEQTEGGVIYKSKTVINFGEDTIDGDLLVPDGAYIESRKKVRHSNLIRIRENFRELILGSASQL